jgi:SAM-dependent methyltransferase
MNANIESTSIDNKKLEEFVKKSVEDMGSSISALMIMLGDRLGLYKTLQQYGPLTSEELAKKTDTSERYIREWLASQAAAGYISYNTTNKKFTLPPENAMVLADENSPVFIMGGYQIIRSLFKNEDKFAEIFKTGKGFRWGDHHHDLFEGTARYFKSGYLGNLVQSWIPSLEGIENKLKKGAKVADIGCGYGISTTIMAKSFPNSQFYGYDNHGPSIEAAKENAIKENVKSNTNFLVVSASNESIGNDYDLISFFDCLHDMGDPLGALKFAKQSLKSDGTCMIVEPLANDKLEDNLNLMGKISYAVSSIVCVPNSLADNGPALGAQVGEQKIKDLVYEAGFSRFRRATQTPLNVVYEARP